MFISLRNTRRTKSSVDEFRPNYAVATEECLVLSSEFECEIRSSRGNFDVITKFRVLDKILDLSLSLYEEYHLVFTHAQFCSILVLDENLHPGEDRFVNDITISPVDLRLTTISKKKKN